MAYFLHVAAILAIFLECIATIPHASAASPTAVCNKDYIAEGQSLDCNCTAPASSVTPSVTWPGHSNTSGLTVDSVRREDNGTVFTCMVSEQGVASGSTSVTLLVAYGPTDDSTTITSHPAVVTNSTKSVTLTCHAKDVYPSVAYSWSGLCIGNTSDCTFSPRPENEGDSTYCTAFNSIATMPHSFHVIKGLATYKLQFAKDSAQEGNDQSDNESTAPNQAGRTEWQRQFIFVCFMVTMILCSTSRTSFLLS